jgi:hypothetical protein
MITTRYHGPTNHKGSRVSARTYGGRRITILWDYALGIAENHDRAARLLAERERLTGRFLRVCAPDHTPDACAYVRDHMPVAFAVANVQQQIEALRAQSELAWEMAVDTAGSDEREAAMQALADECDDAWQRAVDALDADLNASLEALEEARSLEREGGDDSHARRAQEILTP